MLAKTSYKDLNRALKVCVHKKPDTDCARHCIATDLVQRPLVQGRQRQVIIGRIEEMRLSLSIQAWTQLWYCN
jgi:hypothetical protein